MVPLRCKKIGLKFISNETVWAIGSITKTMTAMLVMMLVDEGRVALDDPIGAHVADLPKKWRKFTVAQLLSHTSGVPGDLDNPCGHAVPSNASYTLRDMFREVTCLPLRDAPGAAFHYADQNYQMLGLLIEATSGASYEEALRRRIFDPLGMASAGLLDNETVIEGRADGYARRGEGYVNAPPMDPAIEFSSGGVVATIGDLATFVAAVGARRLLSDESWDAMWSRPPGVEDTPYGFGFGLTPYAGFRRVGHNGAAVGYASAFSWFPDLGAGVVVLSNGYQEPFGRNVQDLAHDIARRAGVVPSER